MNRLRIATLATAALLLAACEAQGPGGPGGGPGPGPGPGGGFAGTECTVPIIGNGVGITVATNANCLACSGENPEAVIDTDPATFGTADLTLGLVFGEVAFRVTAPPGTVFPASNIAGGVFRVNGADLILAAVLPDITIRTYLAGTLQQEDTIAGVVNADVLALLQDDTPFFAGITTTLPFDAVELAPSLGLLGALNVLDVFAACGNATSVGAYPSLL